mmetsp:Transcript_1033/g.1719  ORF Transcript_1033/g.1719 Transcript_1033/m.1719 type:complete len:217 (-) Transcript_1033:278-928(-)
MKAQQSLRAVQVLRPLPEQVHHEHVEPLRVQVAAELDADALDQVGAVLELLPVVVEEVRIVREDALHVEGVDRQDLIERRAAPFCLDDGSELVQAIQSSLELVLLVFRDEIDLVQEDLIGERHLMLRLVHGSVRLLLVEVHVDVLGVGQAHDRIDPVVVAHLGIRLDGVHDGSRVGEAGGFEYHGVEILSTLGELTERPDQVAPDGTADAAVVHGD